MENEQLKADYMNLFIFTIISDCKCRERKRGSKLSIRKVWDRDQNHWEKKEAIEIRLILMLFQNLIARI